MDHTRGILPELVMNSVAGYAPVVDKASDVGHSLAAIFETCLVETSHDAAERLTKLVYADMELLREAVFCESL